jgi:hypothetical protein
MSGPRADFDPERVLPVRRAATRLLAATGNEIAVLEEHDAEWEVSTTLAMGGAQCVAVDSARSQAAYAGSRGRGLWRSSDGGRTWDDAALPERDVFSVAVSAADGSVYAGCEPSRLFVARDGDSWRELEALQAIPSKATWSFPPRPWTSHVRWIAPNPHEASVLLVGIELGGLMRSDDGGESFADHRPGAQRDVHALAWHPDVPGWAYEAAGGGTAWSSDWGDRWEPLDAGRDRHYAWALAVDPVEPRRWFVSVSPGPFQAHGRGSAGAFVYRLRDDLSWEALDGGLPQPLDAMPYALLFVGERLFAGLRDGRLYASPDGGDTWEQLRLVGDSLPSIVALAEAGLN